MSAADRSVRRRGLPLQPAEIALECLGTAYGASILLALSAARRTAGSTGRMRQVDLIRRIQASSEAAFRRDLGQLLDVGSVRRLTPPGAPRRAVFYAITQAGEEMLGIIKGIQLWSTLGHGPGSVFEAARGIRLLARSNQFWANTVMIRLGLGEMTLNQLDEQLSPAVTRAQLRRLLQECHDLHLVTQRRQPGGTSLYGLTPWGRQLIRVVILAHEWELRFIPLRAAALPLLNAQAGLKITVELLRLGPKFEGPVELRGEGLDVERDAHGRAIGTVLKPTGQIAVASAHFEDGIAVSVELSERTVETRSGLGRPVSRFLDGTQASWYSMIARGEIGGMMLGGRLPQRVVRAIYSAYTTPWKP